MCLIYSVLFKRLKGLIYNNYRHNLKNLKKNSENRKRYKEVTLLASIVEKVYNLYFSLEKEKE